MIPKPPFSSGLTEEQVLETFERLKPRLSDLWNALSAREEEPYTSVVIPSMTLDDSELTKLEGAGYYEERLLFLLARLRNPRARMVYVTSQPVHPVILEYYFQLLQAPSTRSPRPTGARRFPGRWKSSLSRSPPSARTGSSRSSPAWAGSSRSWWRRRRCAPRASSSESIRRARSR